MKIISKSFVLSTLAALAFLPLMAGATTTKTTTTSNNLLQQGQLNINLAHYNKCLKWRCYTRPYCVKYHKHGCFVCHKHRNGHTTVKKTCVYDKVKDYTKRGYACFYKYGRYKSRCYYYKHKWCHRVCLKRAHY